MTLLIEVFPNTLLKLLGVDVCSVLTLSLSEGGLGAANILLPALILGALDQVDDILAGTVD